MLTNLPAEPHQLRRRFLRMVTAATKLGVSLIVWAVIASAVLAQKPPTPGPTVPDPSAPEKSLPVPKSRDNLVINPTTAECKAGWRPGMRWTREEFEAFCRQFEISK
jgi:hypothetical protein